MARVIPSVLLVSSPGTAAGLEYGRADEVFQHPGHPYTWGLLASMPRLDRDRQERLDPIAGTPPSLIQLPAGCPFHPRCAYAALNGGRSEREVPALRETAPRHLTACHLPFAERRRIRAESMTPPADSPASGGGAR